MKRVTPVPRIEPMSNKRNSNPVDRTGKKRTEEPGFKEKLEEQVRGRSTDNLPDNFKRGGNVKPGLYANIAAKKKRIASGSGEKMRSVGAKGAPKKSDFVNAAKTATYKEGGEAKSKVNEAGNYTKPELRKRIFNSVKAAAVQGTGAGQWSARKAQLTAKRYKAAGGGYK
jgi:hypothetical protein